MSIVTKKGDKGETSLMYGRRLSKADPRVDAYGYIDELTAALGLARSFSTDKFISGEILAAQKDLIVVMGELATATGDRETPLSAAIDFARTTCRRAERRIATLGAGEKDLNPEILRYLNRLSDLCWVLARYAEKGSR